MAERKAGHSLAAGGAATQRRMGQTVTGICAKDNNTDSHTLSAASLLLTLSLASQSVSVSLSLTQILSESSSLNRERVRPESVWVEGGREGGREGGPGPTSGVWCAAILIFKMF